MNFVFSASSLEVYRESFEEVAQFYLGLFEDTKLFQSKLLFTSVNMTLARGSAQSKAVIRCLNSGYEIWMDINPVDKKDYIIHQFGHELAHLMLMPLRFNYCVSNAFNNSDESYAITTLTRKTGSVTYGILFEEAFCNWLSLKALSYVLKKDYTNSTYISKRDISLMDTVVSSFEMERHAKWDSLCKDGTPANSFLYGIACGDISYAIGCVDKVVGRGSWKGLMYSSYVFLTESPEKERKEAFWKIKLLLKEFKKSMKGSELKYA